MAAEAFTLGAACGFAPERLLEVFAHTDAKSFFMTDYVAPRVARGDVSPGFTVELQLKDHRLAAELGHEQRVPLPLNALAIDAWERMRAQGRGANDVTDAVFFSAEQARRELGARPAPTGRAPRRRSRVAAALKSCMPAVSAAAGLSAAIRKRSVRCTSTSVPSCSPGSAHSAPTSTRKASIMGPSIAAGAPSRASARR